MNIFERLEGVVHGEVATVIAELKADIEAIKEKLGITAMSNSVYGIPVGSSVVAEPEKVEEPATVEQKEETPTAE